jgi:hypothetical protein
MIDEAIVAYATPGLFGLRANSAQAADRPEVLLESISAIAESSLRMPNREQHAAELRASLERLIQSVDGLRPDKRISAQRRDEVRKRLEQGLRELEAPTIAATAPRT